MRKLLAFIKRDILVRLSYRFNLLLGLIGLTLSMLMLYFLSRAFGAGTLPFLARYGGEYFPYALIGIAVSNFVTVGLDTLSRQVRSAQLEGTLEALISTQTSIYTILIGNSLTIFLTAFFSATVLLFGGFAILRIKIPLAGYAASILILTLTFLAFLILGMLSASFVMIFKRGDPIAYIFGWSSFFLGGVLFPIEVLPSPLQSLAQMLPVTHAIKAIRELLLASSGLLGVTSLLRNFLLFTGIMAPVGGLFFRFAVKKAKRDGNLIQY